MPIKPVTDPSLLQQLNAGGNVVASNPLYPAQAQKAQAEATTATATAPYAGPKAEADARAAEAQARLAEAQAAVANAKNATDLKIAQADLQKTQLELQQAQSGKGGALKALQDQVDRVAELYRQRLKGGLPNAVNGVIPDAMQPNVAAFNAAAQGLTNPFMAAFRIPGVGSQSDTELRQFLAANTPSPNDPDAVIEEKLRNIQTRIDAEQATRGQSALVPPNAPPSGDQVNFATGKTRDVADPVLKATGQRVGRMIAEGVPDAKIISFLQKSGVDPTNTNVQQALQFRKTDDFKRWQRANPGAAYPIGPDFYTKQVPMSDARQLLNKAAATGPGGAAMAAGAGFTNAVTGGYLNDLTMDPEAAQTGMDLLRGQHPLASFAGDVGGQLALEGMAGAIPGAGPLLATRMGRRGLDLAYGAYSGSGENDQDRLGGALTGALVNSIGGGIGRNLQRGAGDLMTGIKNANLGYLNRAGVPLTVGQIGNGSNSVVGKAIGGIEDRAAGLPVFDSIINSARRRGEQGFNSAAFREAGGSGATGARGVEELSNNVNNAYSFLDPVALPIDAQFAGSQAGVRAALPDLPKYGPEIGAGLNLIDKASTDGALTGRDWQQALRTVKSDRASLKGKEFSQGATDLLGDVEDNLLNLANRQSPSSLQGDLARANDLNKQFRTITGALDKGPSQARGELFSSSALDTAARASQRKYGGQVSSMMGNRPFYDLTQAGMDVMPNQVPDSGTAGRALLYSALFGGGLGAGIGTALNSDDRAEGGITGSKVGLAIPLAVAGLYSKPGQKAIQKLLLGERPLLLNNFGERLKNNPILAGILGQAAARDYAYQPELPQ